MLYLCATPIGNLGDISERVLATLREVDVIAAEDTRQTIKLLNHFDIKKQMIAYHEHNRYEMTPVLVERMLAGEDIALVTDAGTPAPAAGILLIYPPGLPSGKGRPGGGLK